MTYIWSQKGFFFHTYDKHNDKIKSTLALILTFFMLYVYMRMFSKLLMHIFFIFKGEEASLFLMREVHS